MNKTHLRVMDMLAGLADIDRMFDGRKTIYLSLPNDIPAMEALGKYLAVVDLAGEDCSLVSPVLAALVSDKDGNPKYNGKQIGEMVENLIRKCDEFWVLLDTLSPNMVSEIYRAARMGKKVYGVYRRKEDDQDV